MNKIEEETGLNPGFINNGGLFIAHNEVNRISFIYFIINMKHMFFFLESSK